jgi:hypothetical protein
MERAFSRLTALLFSTLLIAAGCTPISSSNPPTGNVVGPIIGGALGATGAAAAGLPKPFIGLVGVLGAGLGYYATTERFAAAGIIHSGGQIFTQGDFLTIEIPTDRLFDVNTSELLPGTDVTLDSVVKILNRYPRNNILISGNTSGFGSDRYEQKLSEARAREVSAYLWAHGISTYSGTSINTRKLIYVGYGSYFPVGNSIRLAGIRSNSRIQITAYPSKAQLCLNKKFKEFNDIGNLDEPRPIAKSPVNVNSAFEGDNLPGGTDLAPDNFNDHRKGPQPATENHDYSNDVKGEFSDEPMKNYNKVESAPQTVRGPREIKHGGYKGEADFKGDSSFKEDESFKGESP